jgi:hypothetical protein
MQVVLFGSVNTFYIYFFFFYFYFRKVLTVGLDDHKANALHVTHYGINNNNDNNNTLNKNNCNIYNKFYHVICYFIRASIFFRYNSKFYYLNFL